MHAERLQQDLSIRWCIEILGAAGDMWEGAEVGRWLCKQCSEIIPEKDKSTHEDFHIALDMSKEQPGVDTS